MTATPTLARFSALGVDFALSGSGRPATLRRRCELTPTVQREIEASALEIAIELHAVALVDAMLSSARGER